MELYYQNNCNELPRISPELTDEEYESQMRPERPMREEFIQNLISQEMEDDLGDDTDFDDIPAENDSDSENTEVGEGDASMNEIQQNEDEEDDNEESPILREMKPITMMP